LPSYTDGILGLSRWSSKSFPYPLIIDRLKETGEIDQKIFSLLMLNDKQQSMLEIGGYDSLNARDGENSIKWISLNDTFFWTTTIEGFRIGHSDLFSNGAPSSFQTRPYYAIFDSGTSLAYLPSCKYQFYDKFILIAIGAQIISFILRGKKFTSSNFIFNVPCDKALYESLYLQTFEGYWLELHPDNYILPDLDNPNQCVLGMVINSKDHFLLGSVFLRNYFQIYDIENSRLGLAPHKYSKVQTIE
jgi:Eukaryotic aspartyl protease